VQLEFAGRTPVDLTECAGQGTGLQATLLFANDCSMDRYQDPYSDYGRLSAELLRAVRLVLDTGVHYKHWTRQQMVDYFHNYTSEDEPDLQAETDRYIAIPGQALGYMLGKLDILRLRQKAKDELSAKYDIRAFHDEVLNAGALPLNVMDQRVEAWIAQQKSATGK
jgi:uncharacterized protein (DUF885 family)